MYHMKHRYITMFTRGSVTRGQCIIFIGSDIEKKGREDYTIVEYIDFIKSMAYNRELPEKSLGRA